MSNLRFDPAALEELARAAELHEQERPGYGRRFVAEVDDIVQRIMALPKSGKPVADAPAELDAREFLLRRFPYSVVTVTAAGERVVIAVAHHHRRPGYWKSRLK